MKKKFLKITIIAILLIWMYTTIASALSFTATMTPSSTSVDESTEFTISIKVSNLDVGSNGINTLSGTLTYDQTIFETISDSSIEGLNSWSQSYNAQTGKITLTKTTFVKTEESVFQITLKTKSDVKGKTGTIQFTDIVASNSESEITASDISTTITVGKDNTNTGNTSNTNSGNTLKIKPTNNVVNNTSKNVANNSSIPYNNVNTSSDDDIPYTGVEDTIMYLVVAFIVVAIVFYIKFEKINKEIK